VSKKTKIHEEQGAVKPKLKRKANQAKTAVVVAEVLETEPTKVIDLDGADARRVAEKKAKATAAVKTIERSPYQIGYDDGYKNGLKDSTTRTIHSFVAAVEQKLAEHDGYADPEKWRREATIPAWWIAVLMTQMESEHHGYQ